jgi:ATP-dependent DNA helicase RecQ
MGLVAQHYHGALPRKRRETTHAAFLDGSVPIVVATNASGLGIDKPDVRLIVHADPPDDLDSYYQQIGRAGRDGEPARAVLISRPDGYAIAHYFTARSGPSADDLQAVFSALDRKPARLKLLAEHTGLSTVRVRRAVNVLGDVGAVMDRRSGVLRASWAPDPAGVVRAAEQLSEQRRVQSEAAVNWFAGMPNR